MGVAEAGERDAHRFRLRGVDADARAAALGAELEYVEGAPRAGDDCGQASYIRSAFHPLPRNVLPSGTVEQFQMPLHRVAGVFGFDCLRIGSVDEGELSGRVAGPNR